MNRLLLLSVVISTAALAALSVNAQPVVLAPPLPVVNILYGEGNAATVPAATIANWIFNSDGEYVYAVDATMEPNVGGMVTDDLPRVSMFIPLGNSMAGTMEGMVLAIADTTLALYHVNKTDVWRQGTITTENATFNVATFVNSWVSQPSYMYPDLLVLNDRLTLIIGTRNTSTSSSSSTMSTIYCVDVLNFTVTHTWTIQADSTNFNMFNNVDNSVLCFLAVNQSSSYSNFQLGLITLGNMSLSTSHRITTSDTPAFASYGTTGETLLLVTSNGDATFLNAQTFNVIRQFSFASSCSTMLIPPIPSGSDYVFTCDNGFYRVNNRTGVSSVSFTADDTILCATRHHTSNDIVFVGGKSVYVNPSSNTTAVLPYMDVPLTQSGGLSICTGASFDYGMMHSWTSTYDQLMLSFSSYSSGSGDVIVVNYAEATIVAQLASDLSPFGPAAVLYGLHRIVVANTKCCSLMQAYELPNHQQTNGAWNYLGYAATMPSDASVATYNFAFNDSSRIAYYISTDGEGIFSVDINANIQKLDVPSIYDVNQQPLIVGQYLVMVDQWNHLIWIYDSVANITSNVSTNTDNDCTISSLAPPIALSASSALFFCDSSYNVRAAMAVDFTTNDVSYADSTNDDDQCPGAGGLVIGTTLIIATDNTRITGFDITTSPMNELWSVKQDDTYIISPPIVSMDGSQALFAIYNNSWGETEPTMLQAVTALGVDSVVVDLDYNTNDDTMRLLLNRANGVLYVMDSSNITAYDTTSSSSSWPVLFSYHHSASLTISSGSYPSPVIFSATNALCFYDNNQFFNVMDGLAGTLAWSYSANPLTSYPIASDNTTIFFSGTDETFTSGVVIGADVFTGGITSYVTFGDANLRGFAIYPLSFMNVTVVIASDDVPAVFAVATNMQTSSNRSFPTPPSPPPPPSSTCADATTCDACTALAGCGFCTLSNVCEDGTSSGSSQGSCSGSDWAWTSTQCSAPPSTCSDMTNCKDCTSLSHCGFCASTSMCEDGNSTSGSSGCAGTDWEWFQSDCPVVSSCSDATTCDDCTAMADCGFCAVTNACEDGTVNGSSVSTCTNSDWSWLSTQCSISPPTCSDITDCKDCTYTAGCGFCMSSNACESGDSSGSTSGTCTGSNWAWYSSTCPATGTCSSASSCDDCTQMAGCGFCSLTGSCEDGTFSGSTVSGCSGSDWSWVSDQCYEPSPCEMAFNCKDCTTLPFCGFCASTNSCQEGYANNSVAGCSGADWLWEGSMCPAPTMSCSDATTCDECTAMTTCGFCATTGVCQEGGVQGSTDGTCVGMNWSWITDQCFGLDLCQNLDTCKDCTDTQGCGFCFESNTCQSGNESNSWYGCSGSNWVWEYDMCPMSNGTSCADALNCGDCTRMSQCGYCTSTSTCEDGVWNGSTTSGCANSDWVWYSEQCQDSSCWAMSTCKDCTSLAQCGFCVDSGLCEDGNANYSVTGCSGSSWIKNSDTCPIPVTNCSWATDCGDCTLMSACGFCSATGTCEAGSSTGSSSGSCTGTNWIWTNNMCAPTMSCDMADNCKDCTAMAGCGYCASSDLCENGNATSSFDTGCGGNEWQWTSDQCAASSSSGVTCADAGNCGDCAAMAGCGYCLTTNRCEEGTNASSTESVCTGTNWAWTSFQCGAPTRCEDASNCKDCTAIAICGFCASSGLCQEGTDNSSILGCSGADWQWLPSQCPVPPPSSNACSNATTCGGCTALSGCGFCLATGVCEMGFPNGSATGTCHSTQWSWLTSQCFVRPNTSAPTTSTAAPTTTSAPTPSGTPAPITIVYSLNFSALIPDAVTNATVLVDFQQRVASLVGAAPYQVEILGITTTGNVTFRFETVSSSSSGNAIAFANSLVTQYEANPTTVANALGVNSLSCPPVQSTPAPGGIIAEAKSKAWIAGAVLGPIVLIAAIVALLHYRKKQMDREFQEDYVAMNAMLDGGSPRSGQV